MAFGKFFSASLPWLLVAVLEWSRPHSFLTAVAYGLAYQVGKDSGSADVVLRMLQWSITGCDKQRLKAALVLGSHVEHCHPYTVLP